MLKNFKNIKVLVIGSGISGIGAANLLEGQGALVSIFDENPKTNKAFIKEKLNHSDKVDIYIEVLSQEVMSQIQLCVLSPGVPLDHVLVTQLHVSGVPIWGEIELACHFEKGSMIGITGTNGKTTTTTLVGDIMKAYFKDVFVVGNIGNPYTVDVVHTNQDSITVAELSSFQLETVHQFYPHISAILNVTPDHLNRHYTMENYAIAKEMIGKNQTKDDFCILNYDNEYTRAFGRKVHAEVIWFSSKQKVEHGYYLCDEKIVSVLNGREEVVLDIETDVKLVGICNYENIMAAIAIAQAMGVPLSIIKQVIQQFRAVEHRIEFVETKRQVDYYNDSKGTNPDAAIQGVKAMRKPTILIGGGYDKENEYDEWIQSFKGVVKTLILIGQTKEKIAECAKKHGFLQVVLKETFLEACEYATHIAKAGDAVLLSPACASWGMFPNYEARGNLFKEYVKNIKE